MVTDTILMFQKSRDQITAVEENKALIVGEKLKLKEMKTDIKGVWYNWSIWLNQIDKYP